MWKWTIKLDKAFDLPTYRVKADGLIVGTIRQFGSEWSWEATFPAQAMPEWCSGTRPTLEECREAIREAVATLTEGMSRGEAQQQIVRGLYRT